MAHGERATGSEDQRRRPPPLTVALAASGALPLLGAAFLSLVLPRPGRSLVARFAIVWSGTLLCFFGGVRRGLSFRQENGATAGELGATVTLFGSGVVALLLPWRRVSLGWMVAVFAAEALLDRNAAEDREAPRYFATLRPLQLAAVTASLLIVLLRDDATGS